MKKILSFILTSALAVTTAIVPATVVASAETQLTDIKGHWAEETIAKWVSDGKVKGYVDGSFKPENKISRAEFIAIVNRAYGFSEVAEISYKDVKSGAWYYTEIAKAKQADYIGGYDDGTMKPDNPISRQEAAMIIKKLNKLEDNATKASSFKDNATIPSWSKGAIGAVAEAGIMKGDNYGMFLPLTNLKRAEAVVTLDRSIQLNKPSEITIDLPETKEIPINTKDEIIRFTTSPADVNITATTDTTDYLTLNAFSTKLTVTSKSKPGTTKVTLTATKDGYDVHKQVINIVTTDKKSESALSYDARNLTEERFSLFYKDESISMITGNFTLPDSGEKGSRITWESDNTAVVKVKDNRAEVTRPYYTDGEDTTVKLTATIENNGLSETKVFHVTVLKAEISNDATVTSEVYTVEYTGARYQITSNREGVTESLTVDKLLSNLSKYEYAQWKVVSSTSKITNSASFDKASGKSGRTNITDGDYVAVLAEDGATVKAYQLKTMDQVDDVSDFEWSDPGVLSWTDCDGEYGYILSLYKNEELISEETVKSNVITYDFLEKMKKHGIGKYTAKIIAKGDMTRRANSASVETATVQQLKQLSQPVSVSWSGTNAKWGADSNADSYKIDIYKDGVLSESITADAGVKSIDLNRYLKTSGSYMFKVTAVAGEFSSYIDSLPSEFSGSYSK